MSPGDVVFMYKTAPRSAITDVFRVVDSPRFDPYGAWDGFWVEIKRVGGIPDIPFRQLANDEVTSKWGMVRRQFIGTVTEPIPYPVYNQLLKFMGQPLQTKYQLRPEGGV
jgi:hypothetical protein